jgi:catechol 2,3-dioxygenase-like lactoylglutathione lyase family enzyme
MSHRLQTRIAVISLWAQDVSATAHFYRDIVGLPLVAHHGDRPHFDLGGSYLVILKGTPSPAQDAIPARFPLVAFTVEDLDAAVARLQAHGVPLPWGVEADDRSRWIMFHDPGGNLVELVQLKQSSS